MLSFQHTAARRRLVTGSRNLGDIMKFQHTAARRRLACISSALAMLLLFQHTAARRRLGITPRAFCGVSVFQHTAARRRLGINAHQASKKIIVSTHSRPKAAGRHKPLISPVDDRFNTQPPEGGWSLSQKPCSIRFRSPDFAKLPRKARTRV